MSVELFSHGGSLDYEPAGEYVTKRRVDKVRELLESGERVMYLTKGSAIAVTPPETDIVDGPVEFAADYAPFGMSFFRRPVRTIVTDQRILLSAPHGFSHNTQTIDYDEITAIDLTTDTSDQRLTIETPNEAYWVHISQPSKHEAREIPRFIHEQVANTAPES